MYYTYNQLGFLFSLSLSLSLGFSFIHSFCLMTSNDRFYFLISSFFKTVSLIHFFYSISCFFFSLWKSFQFDLLIIYQVYVNTFHLLFYAKKIFFVHIYVCYTTKEKKNKEEYYSNDINDFNEPYKGLIKIFFFIETNEKK